MNLPPPRLPARQPFKWNHAVPERDTEEPSRLDTCSGHKAQFGDQATHESLLDLFLDTGSFSLQSAYEPYVFKRIFKEDTLENIRDGKHGFQDPQQLVAWVHDRNCDNQSRPTNGSKTGEEFLKLIKLKRFKQDGMVDAHTRRIYIPNPNESAMGILALRASEHQTPAIKSLIFKHLEADTSIGLQLTPEGEFILEFHMPYFAWRKTSYLVNDSRTLTNNNPLRRSFDLSFLSETKMEKLIVDENNYLYEAHTAFCITGRATSVWTAVCLADTFFDEQDPNNEQMLSYYTNNNDSDPMFYDTDALSVGELTADGVSVKDPREYFLLIAKSQVKKVGKEWKDICGWLKQKIEEYLQDPHIPLHRRQTSLETAADEAYTAEKSEAWLKQIGDLLTRLISALSKTIRAWKNFEDRDVARLASEDNEDLFAGINDSCRHIRESMYKMEEALVVLKDLKSEVENFRSQFSTHINVNNYRAIVLQQSNTTIFQVFPKIVIIGVIKQTTIQVGTIIYSTTISVIRIAGIFATSAKSFIIEWLTQMAQVTQRSNQPPAISEEAMPIPNVRSSTTQSFYSASASSARASRNRNRYLYHESDSDNVASSIGLGHRRRPRFGGNGPNHRGRGTQRSMTDFI